MNRFPVSMNVSRATSQDSGSLGASVKYPQGLKLPDDVFYKTTIDDRYLGTCHSTE